VTIKLSDLIAITTARRPWHNVWLVLLLYPTIGCGEERMPPGSTATLPRLPVGLFGTWVQASRVPAPDTLVLREDSTARGWNRRHDEPPMFVTRWKVAFLSKDPISSRADFLGMIYQDGGDLSCTMAPDSTCVSAPVLCLGDATKYDCMGFRYRNDSLALSNGARYQRIAMRGGEGPR
jgi:hypothetical protein